MKEKTDNCLLKIVNWQFAPQVNTKQGAELQYCLVVIQIVLHDRKITLFRLGQCRRKSSYHYQSQVFYYLWTCVGEQKSSFCGLKIIYRVIILLSLFSLMLEQ